MRKWLFEKLLHLPEFKGKWRLVQSVRAGMEPYRCTTDFGFAMELDCFEWAQLHIAQHGNSEPKTMKRVQELLKPGDTYVDVGAHVGFVSLVARQAVGESGRVIAVDPQPYNCQHLLRNWEINGFSNLDLHVAAAGNEPGFISLPQQSTTDKSRLSLALPMPDATDLRFQVPIRKLSAIIEESRADAIKLLKIDVEGYEVEVLKGLEGQIDCVEQILFESLETEGDELKASRATREWLVDHDFELKDICGQAWNPDDEILEGNLLAVRRAVK